MAESIELPPESRKFHEKKYVKGSECSYIRQMINLIMIKRNVQSSVLQLSPRSGVPNWGTCTPWSTFRLLKRYIIM